ncbi:PAS/PAC sensor signal transduction histidine kinase [Emticicia oligotrophica DSM 17448]|uniref:histidine kinase n=1 Tax=Emticicia oligotrophica (strain DSM 17448 / CIP 109782 / MTCC 6937 / GPTSA100-15) TaxID=929562 RepID=A0ABM5MWN6_EMTOG|nr:PAS domain-containing sensor histidine kinase [Emticicia oligotrophica]AFK01530.1 PAS/PAC sensor signal transduction histidine kinase [Emticicia oligotrophica DSM 17448]
MIATKISIAEKDMLNQVEAIFQYATEAILITNIEGNIVKVNPSTEMMFGYTSAEFFNQPIELLIPDRLKVKHEAHRKMFQECPHARSMGANLDLYGRRKDGSEFPVEVSLSPYSNSQGSFVIAFIIDTSIRKKAEAQLIAYKAELEREVEERTMILKEAIHKLEQTKDELDNSLKREREVNSMKSRFISIASHEFRTPLATVLSSLSLVEKYSNMQEEEKRIKHINRIKASVRNLTDILNDFLSLNRLEEGKVLVNIETFNLHDLIESLMQDLQGICKGGQRIVLNFSDNGHSMVSLDKTLIRNIIINLVSNAIKFSPENAPIQIQANLGENEVFITVTDQGIGIPEADQKHLFERFFRSSNAIEIQGTGLGLSIVLHYVNLLKGTIKFKSKVNEGTTFYVNLPRNF